MDRRFPIGQFVCPDEIKEQEVDVWIEEMRSLPSKVRELTHSLDESALTQTYREGSWNVRQLVHHIVDSHLNGYIRMKAALTEDNPAVKSYEESDWALMGDYDMPIEVSLQLLEALHERWTYLLRTLTNTQLKRTYQSPDGSALRLEQSIGLYAWHGNHHLAHIRLALADGE